MHRRWTTARAVALVPGLAAALLLPATAAQAAAGAPPGEQVTGTLKWVVR
ncbi:hypothetical protein ACQEU3_44655 [Spirillospora sp. CA-253888]